MFIFPPISRFSKKFAFLQVELTALREVKAQLERDLKIQKDMVVEKVCLYLFVNPCLSLTITFGYNLVYGGGKSQQEVGG